MAVKKNILFEIYKELKLKRVVLNQEEYAAKLDYSRSHLHRLMNNPNDVDDELIKKAKALLNETKDTKNVSRETLANEDDAPYNNTFDRLLKVLEQHAETINSQQKTIQFLAEREPIKPPDADDPKNDLPPLKTLKSN